MLMLVMPWPPSANTYWRRNGSRYFISQKGIQYRDEVFKTHHDGLIKFDGRISMKVLAYPPDKRRRDLDNLLKAVQDSLQYAKIFEDDSQIDRITVERMNVSPQGRLVVTIEKITCKESLNE